MAIDIVFYDALPTLSEEDVAMDVMAYDAIPILSKAQLLYNSVRWRNLERLRNRLQARSVEERTIERPLKKQRMFKSGSLGYVVLIGI